MVTEQEYKVIMLLADIWNEFLKLPQEHGDDITEFRFLVHQAQEKILARSGRRAMNEE